jgi:hypothetical protein
MQKKIFGISTGDEDGSTPVEQYKSPGGASSANDDDADDEPQEEVVC